MKERSEAKHTTADLNGWMRERLTERSETKPSAADLNGWMRERLTERSETKPSAAGLDGWQNMMPLTCTDGWGEKSEREIRDKTSCR